MTPKAKAKQRPVPAHYKAAVEEIKTQRLEAQKILNAVKYKMKLDAMTRPCTLRLSPTPVRSVNDHEHCMAGT